MNCHKKECPENSKGKCILGLHPSWATCPQNEQKSVTFVEGTSFDKHKQLYQNFLNLGCCDGEREDSRR